MGADVAPLPGRPSCPEMYNDCPTMTPGEYGRPEGAPGGVIVRRTPDVTGAAADDCSGVPGPGAAGSGRAGVGRGTVGCANRDTPQTSTSTPATRASLLFFSRI